MKLIVGLGNIGKEYENTRHNVGFMVVDKLSNKLNANFEQSKFKASIAMINYKGEKVIIMKPSTYMNLSGEAVLACVNFYKILVEDILIIHDDLDLPVGSVRIRMQGSAGGQKGMNNIINLLHTSDIKRIRVGIDKMIIDHTSVIENYRNAHVGLNLVRCAANLARTQRRKVITMCPFASAMFSRFPEFDDVRFLHTR